MKRRIALLCLMAMFAFASTAAESRGVLKLSPDQTMLDLDTYITYLEDPEGTLAIESLIINEHVWRTLDQKALSFGFTGSTYWVRLKLALVDGEEPPAAPWVFAVNNPILDWIDIYLYQNGTQIAHHSLGDKLPYAQRLVDYPHFVVPVNLQPGDITTVFLKVRSNSSVLIPMRLYSTQRLIEQSYEKALGQALFYGAMLIMAIYNLLILMSLRDISYFYYAMMVLSTAILLAGIEGITFKYLWPDASWLNDVVPILSLSSLVAFAALFFRSFLALPESRPFLGHLALGFVAAAALIVLGAFFLPYQQMMMLSVLLAIGGILCGIWAGISRWLDGFHGALVFNIAWSCVLIAGMLLALTSLGILPLEWFSMHVMQIGAGLQAALLSFAMANRMRFEKSMGELARQGAAEARRKMLAHQMETNESLDRLILERTEALEQTNTKLREISTTDGLTQLLNRRAFEEAFLNEYSRSHRNSSSIAVLMIDLDHFKNVNDNYGHAFGDICLVSAAEVIRDCLRHPYDIAARYGGEEFIVILPGADTLGAVAVAEDILMNTRQKVISDGQFQLTISASIGVASCVPTQPNDQEKLLQTADSLLYLAKANGRNRLEWRQGSA